MNQPLATKYKDYVVILAIQKGIIKEKGNNGNYFCNLCFKPISGIDQALQHLQGKPHQKKENENSSNKVVSHGINTDINKNQPITTRDKDFVVLPALQKGKVKEIDNNGNYWCNLCSKNVSGFDQMSQHLQGKPHQKKEIENSANKGILCDITTDRYKVSGEEKVITALREQIIEEKDKSRHLYFCRICQDEISGEIVPHLDGRDHANSGVCWVINNPRTFPESLKQYVPTLVLDAANRKDIKVLLSRKNTFKCLVCNKDINGTLPLKIHLESHQPHVEESIPHREPVLASSRMLNALLSNGYENPTPINFPPPGKEYLTNDVCFPKMDIEILGPIKRSLKGSKDDVYFLRSRPPGLVVIFNYIFENDVKNYRRGADEDSRRIMQSFERLGYKVVVYRDKTKQETQHVVKEIFSSAYLRDIDSFICFILSHGESSTQFLTKGRKLMDLDDIRLSFIDSKCPNLVGKPKIFIANFCRGKYKEIDLKTDSLTESDRVREAPKDMVTFFASIKDFVAIRHEIYGSVFITSFCNTVDKYSSKELMGEFKRNLYNEMMKQREIPTPEVQDYLFRKKFYFKP